ncbi:MAG TPA: hypothetical protein VFE50_07380 [Cyclobacteriaceae bacterium]|nr:hypothetical protein [Cyclobacteriaceae bacterium]
MRIVALFLVFITSTSLGQKEDAIRYIESHKAEFVALSDSIWKLAEPSYRDERSAELLWRRFEKEGFNVTGNVLNMPSVFIAEYGTSKPVIGLFGEYDADQNATHGGHHNLLGVGSMAAAFAIKRLIDEKKLSCTIRYFGSTDEGGAGLKRFIAAEGYFNDLDLGIYWHPSPVTAASTRKWDALTEFQVPLSDTHLLKELNTTGYKLTFKETDVRIQCAFQKTCDSLYTSIARGRNLVVTKNIHQFLPNVTAMRVVQKNMELLGSITYSDAERQYANPDDLSDKIPTFSDQSKAGKMYGYSSDIGEASRIAPEIYFVVKTLPFVNMHTPQAATFSNHPIGHKGMIHASKIIALTIIDYVKDPALQEAIRSDFEQNVK